MNKHIILIDLFAGIGGFALGLIQGGFIPATHYYSEIDAHAKAVYEYHFPNSNLLGSVTDIKGSTIEKSGTTIVTFGSPCQDFSVAGKQKGLAGARSSLIIEAIRIINETRPDLFIWENVKGTYSSNEGRDFQAILQAFTNLRSYRLEWQLLNSLWFIPQNRERIFLIGHLDQKSTPGVFPFTATDRLSHLQYRGKPIQKQRVQGQNHTSTLDTRYGSVRNSGETYLLINSGLKQGYEVAREGNIVDFQRPTSTSRKGRVQTTKVKTLDTTCEQGVYTQGQIRQLTEVECERLQGFPDDWTKLGVYAGNLKEVSRTRRYHLIGNAVTVKVVKAIGQRLLTL